MIKPGLYRHFKGNLYQVLAVALHSEDHSQYVVYKSKKDGKVWVRPLAMFEEKVPNPDCLTARPIPRFERVSTFEKWFGFWIK